MVTSANNEGDIPMNWNEIVKNLNLADQTTARTMILSSLSSLSMYNIVDLYRWRLEQPFKNINNILMDIR